MTHTVAFQSAMDALLQLAAPIPQWSDILATARDFIGADAGSFMKCCKDLDLLLLEQTGIDEAAEREYREHFHASDSLLNPALDAHPGMCFDSMQMTPNHLAQGSAFYEDYFGKHRIGQVLAFIAENNNFEKARFNSQHLTPQSKTLSNLAQGRLAQYTQALVDALEQRRQAIHARLDAIEATLGGLGEASF